MKTTRAASIEEQPAERSARRSRGRPRLQDVALIDGHLLDVALAEFLKDGYGGASITKIVKAANISKSTLYSRYTSKEQLFRAIVLRQIDSSLAATLLRVGGGGRAPDLEEGLKAYANRTLEVSLQGEMLGVNRLIYSESHRFPELGTAAAERTQMGIAQITEFIRHCGEVEGIGCRNPETVAEAFILLMRGWYLNMALCNRTVRAATREAFVDRAVKLLLASRADW